MGSNISYIRRSIHEFSIPCFVMGVWYKCVAQFSDLNFIAITGRTRICTGDTLWSLYEIAESATYIHVKMAKYTKAKAHDFPISNL